MDASNCRTRPAAALDAQEVKLTIVDEPFEADRGLFRPLILIGDQPGPQLSYQLAAVFQPLVELGICDFKLVNTVLVVRHYGTHLRPDPWRINSESPLRCLALPHQALRMPLPTRDFSPLGRAARDEFPAP